MNHIEPGTYQGTMEGLTFQFRIEHGSDERVRVVSGDISRSTEFIGSFFCPTPEVTADGRTVTGAIVFRGNSELFTGSLYLNTDVRGTGSFQVGVDLEGGHRDIFAGRVDWQGSFLRRLTIEIDGLDGTRPPIGYRTRMGEAMTIEQAFAKAGFDVNIKVDPFQGRGPTGNRMRGYSLAEIHALMMQERSQLPADRLHVHVLVCSYLAGRSNRGVLGVMYDFDQNDLNRRPREGVAVFYDHPMLSDPRIPEELRQREYIFTVVHEIGHALNLLHSFDKARPNALSWMNYPQLYPRGYEAEQDYDGSLEFWRRFEEGFDDDELHHLRHATPREIQAGGFPFGVYEEGVSYPFGGSVAPRRTRLGANPLRTIRDVEIKVSPVKPEYELGEPVFLRIEVKNVGADAVHVPDSLDPSEGYVRLVIQTPTGQQIRYQPPVRLCKQAQLVHLPAGKFLAPFEGVPLFLGANGPTFTEPGNYQVGAELIGVNGSRNIYSQTTRIRIKPPTRATEEFAYKLWDNTPALEALYLRHPLTAKEAWNNLEEELERLKSNLGADNTTYSYFNYIAALGWMTPFATSRHENTAKLDKAVERLARVDPHGLPESVKQRTDQLLENRQEVAARLESEYSPKVIVVRPEEKARVEVPPSGLFGAIGLVEERPEEALDPFVRIVPSLRGTRRFADIVSWNIENLYNPSNFWKIPKVAELIRNFRCDFWGLQEVGRVALARLVNTLNSSGRTRYEFMVVEDNGQQSGAIFRTDTTTVRRLEIPNGFFRNKIEVEMTNGDRRTRDVFLRLPLLCDVRIRQNENQAFDFRCAIVHLKSTDPDFRDKGNGMRKAAAEELARWIRADREAGSERDYLIMGDMNAETAEQGLGPLAQAEELKLLSVGMEDRYGDAEALTRVASQRLLDHIVVTGQASTAMPPEDENEQLIIRSDIDISEWTQSYSDHVPVAVRFIISEDQD